jgi:hypothetical protein
MAAAEELERKLNILIDTYDQPGTVIWEGQTHEGRPLPLLARDFIELFIFDRNVGQIEHFDDLQPHGRRSNRDSVLKVRERIHELNYATMAMYATAVYLGYAQRLSRELAHGRSKATKASQDEAKQLLKRVRTELDGQGKGMVDDLQDLIGESMWDRENAIIGYYAFRDKILSETDWDQYTELFRFFIHLHRKMRFQVKDTRDALRELSTALKLITQVERQWFVRSRSLIKKSLSKRPREGWALPELAANRAAR